MIPTALAPSAAAGADAALADPLHALAATIVLAFVLAEFAIPDLLRPQVPKLARRPSIARLCSLPVYAAAVLWAFIPELAWMGLAFVVAMGLCDLLESRVAWLAARDGGAPGGALVLGYAVLGLRLAALCAFVSLVLAVPPAHWPALTLPNGVAKAVLWAAAYLFVLSGGSSLVGQVLDAVNPAWRGETTWKGELAPPATGAPQREAGVASPGETAGTRQELAAASDSTAPETSISAATTTATALPAAPAPEGAVERHRGRVIGNVERLIVVTLVCLGQFGAIGLVVAAKSLARFPLLAESRDFAEYYLIGTLTSMAVAIGTGLALSLALSW